MGDERAFSKLFEKYYNHLVHYGNSISSFPEKVQDCIQDVFTDIWVYRQNLDESVVVKAYLLSSVRKRISRLQERDHIFRQTTSIDSINFLFDFSIEYHLITDEETTSKVVRINALLNELPPRQKEALYLRYYQGLTVEQIADNFQVNYQSANNILHRALVKLRKEWKHEYLLILLLSSNIH
ncbi:sigma-70 family RNA polymerase sigma factor [Flavobacterium cellulosilyticum]|uniref:Sigma-70 family RNA polymerase sigma factor n=2 Tax=Flavobacterium cellulosilyticum TaxID=2541731 RepID=A0A4R5C9B0_9FLAO|nr:sigma-70 family RNA polymerase sigma factor [Flavobacterium cellulosilyticum]